MEQNCTDPFAAGENSGTTTAARFIGASAASSSIATTANADFASVLEKVAATGIASTSAAAAAAASSCSSVSATHEFQTMKPGNGHQKLITQAACPSTGSTTGGRSEIPHCELVKMLYYLEGELQARDVVIAALRNERVKQYITQLRTKRVPPNDPYAAIFRDKIALAGNLISRESSTQATQAEMEVRQIIEQQMEQQYQMVSKQRATHLRMVNILTESLENNQRMLQELEEEKRKHEHDTAQGDDITYGLELERTKLRQELEEERTQLKKMEKDMKKLQETLDYERNRQKQIVLLLIAERKKILMKYIEEGKRSEDLAQILAEEKQRSDTIAEGLEEESKKSLRMEEDLEKQAAAFEQERKALKLTLAKEEMRAKELDQELSQLRSENEALKKQQQQLQQNAAATAAAAAVGAGKTRTLSEEACAVVVTPMINIAKIVQPTATVSSVPVSGPTTGIARSITPGQNIRSSSGGGGGGGGITIAPTGIAVAPLLATSTANAAAADSSMAVPLTATAVAASSSSIIAAAAAPPSPSPVKMQPTATIQRAPGGKYSALAAAAAASHSLDQPPASPHPVPIAVPPVTVPPAGARGAPPPIPPNKPIVPPKREPSLSRLGSISLASGVSAVAANAAAASTAANASANAKLT